MYINLKKSLRYTFHALKTHTNKDAKFLHPCFSLAFLLCVVIFVICNLFLSKQWID